MASRAASAALRGVQPRTGALAGPRPSHGIMRHAKRCGGGMGTGAFHTAARAPVVGRLDLARPAAAASAAPVPREVPWTPARHARHYTPGGTWPGMRASLYLTPVNDRNLRLAAQVGATDIVAPWPGPDRDAMVQLRDRIASHGLRLSVIERMMPHSHIVHGTEGSEAQTADIIAVIRNMGEVLEPGSVLCYNWMPSDDWTRTSVTEAERGGALVTAFDQAASEAGDTPRLEGQTLRTDTHTSAEALWDNLRRFLEAVVPVAEEAGVSLALHPDDPPLPLLRGMPQIMGSPEALRRAVELVPSQANGICFCQGTLACRKDLDIPAAIRDLGAHIRFVHFRDVVGSVEEGGFRETWQDTGKTDMAACMRAYADVGFTGPIRPDHVPTMEGESNEHPGYEMMGRLWATGYIKGLMDATRFADTAE